MKIGVFGGRFDPVHNGHLAVADEILKRKSVDEIWFLPDNAHQWRPIEAPTSDRIKMLSLAIKKKQKFKVSDIAIKLGGMTETITVMRFLKKMDPNNEYFFICGSDQLPTFPKWTHWEDLLNEVKFWVVARKDYPLDQKYKNCEIIEDPSYKPLNDSATVIREKVKKGESIKNLVSESVEKYILEKGLYK